MLGVWPLSPSTPRTSVVDGVDPSHKIGLAYDDKSDVCSAHASLVAFRSVVAYTAMISMHKQTRASSTSLLSIYF